MVDRFTVGWRTAGLDPGTEALLAYAEKLTAAPASVGVADVMALREQGFEDEAISSCVQVIAYFNYINRIAEGLGCGLEDWLADDGRPHPV